MRSGTIDRAKVDDVLKLLLAALVQISVLDGRSGGAAGEIADEALRKAEEMTR